MNTLYYYEFRGMDDALVRVEILTDDTATATEIKPSGNPLTISYDEIRKLDPVWGSGATLSFISESIFQFVGLHTDNMMKYMVRVYRAGQVVWVGWLDSELYQERMSDYPPYVVEFTAADFNALDRVPYRDDSENRYTGIVTMWTHLTRCLSRLGLPFSKLYVGCTTTIADVTLAASETPLHQLYVTSDNFYDEDGEPMSCREVIESLLRPFALTMTQRDGNLYIYDLNTAANGTAMKRYDFSSFVYEAAETVSFNFGDLSDMQLAGNEGEFGFEGMVNNVTITSSIYADSYGNEAAIDPDNLTGQYSFNDMTTYTLTTFLECEGIERLTIPARYYVYEETNGFDTLVGAAVPYTPTVASPTVVYRFAAEGFLLPTEERFLINVKVDAYANSRENPFGGESAAIGDRSRALRVFCNIYVTDEDGVPTHYFNTEAIESWNRGWKEATGGIVPQGVCALMYHNNVEDSQEDPSEEMLDTWLTNSSAYSTAPSPQFGYATGDYQGGGLYISVPDSGGRVVLEILDKCVIDNPRNQEAGSLTYEEVTNILLDNFSISIADAKRNELSTDDYEFRSYINKNVKNDFDEVELKCITANEEQVPIGRGNILRKAADGSYAFALSFTRSGQTDILERLLMCSIHSNYTMKCEKFDVTIRTVANPVTRYITYTNYLTGQFLIVGSEWNLRKSSARIQCVRFSEDTAQLSDIPYE